MAGIVPIQCVGEDFQLVFNLGANPLNIGDNAFSLNRALVERWVRF